MDFTSPKPPLTQAGFSIQLATVCIESMICGELNLISWLTHLSYTSPPYLPRTTSSSQSVAGQPVAVPEPMPPHQGLPLPAFAMVPLRLIMSAHVVGTLYPACAKALG